MVLVDPDVEEGPAVGRPHGAAGGADDEVGQVRAGLGVADAEREILGALVVEGVGEEAMIGAMGGAAEPEIGLSGGEQIGVDENGLVAAVAAAPHDQRLLGALGIADRIGIGSVGHAERTNRPP